MTTERKGHVVELQSVRGLAAVAVMAGHCLIYYDVPRWMQQASLVFNGRAAVVVFFVLSGLVLTLSLKQARLNLDDLAVFYARRVFRIYPAMWVASVFGLGYLAFLHWRVPVRDTSAFFHERFLTGRYDALHIAASFAGALAFILPQLWSIFVELVASVAMPFVAHMAFRRRGWFWATFAGLLTFSFTLGSLTYYKLGLYGVDFLFGAAIATLGERSRRRVAALQGISPALLIGLGLALCLTQYLPGDYYSPWANLTETLLATGLVALIMYSGADIAPLRSRVALMLGDISYSIYLIHFLVLCLWGVGFALAERHLGLRLALAPKAVLVSGLTVATTLPVSWLSYRYVELPGVALGKAAIEHWRTGLARRSISRIVPVDPSIPP